ncbi:MAG: hypothetical protein HY815_32280 [Candidatus Riflebacteria bacterium]|nr:hypothetical protein [Candidatus Riflebacteria bacterium]
MHRIRTLRHRAGSGGRRCRVALSIIEVLVAVAVLSAVGLPVIYMASRSVETLRLDRTRVAAEEICHGTIERFGRGQDNLQAYLTPLATDPRTLEARNLWERIPEVYSEMGCSRIPEMVEKNGLSMKICRRPGTVPGLDILSCEVSWTRDRQSVRKRDSVTYVRFILNEHVH